jgi:hypothetical protein
MQGEIPVRLEGTSELAIGRLARYYGAPVQGRSATLYLGTCLLTLESTRLPRTDCGGHQGQAGRRARLPGVAVQVSRRRSCGRRGLLVQEADEPYPAATRD